MLTEVQEFKPTNLQEVTVIVHPSDRESVEVSAKIRFKNHKKHKQYDQYFYWSHFMLGVLKGLVHLQIKMFL